MTHLLLTLLLLCGAAQACDWPVPHHPKVLPCTLKTIYSDSMIDTTTLSGIVHKRMVFPDDWCVGRVDTICNNSHILNVITGEINGVLGAHSYKRCGYQYLEIDTTWVRCCDSAARGNSIVVKTEEDSIVVLWRTDVIDTGKTLDWITNPEDWHIKSIDTIVGWCFHAIYPSCPCREVGCCAKVDTVWEKNSVPVVKGKSYYEATYTDSNPCVPIFSPAIMDCRPLWKRFPKRWYIKLVDTTFSDPLYHWGGDKWVLYDNDPYIISIDTTWAKKIPLAEKYLTPEEWEKIECLWK